MTKISCVLVVIFVDGILGYSGAVVSVKEGNSITLNTSVTKQQHDKMLWYFNSILIAHINGEPSKSCLFEGEGAIFRDCLEADFETGSLIITHTRPEHSGQYEAVLIRRESAGKSESLNRSRTCNPSKITKKISALGDGVKTFNVSISAISVISTEEYHLAKREQASDIAGSDSSSSAVVTTTVCVVLLLAVVAAVGVGFYCRKNNKKGEMTKNTGNDLL